MSEYKIREIPAPYKMASGRYGIAVSLGKDDTGKRLRHVETGKSEQEVIDKMKLWLAQNGYMGEEAIILNSQSTIEELAEDFKLRGLKDSGITDITYDNYVNVLNRFIHAFSGRRVGEIDTDDINSFFSKMTKATVNGKYKYSQVSIDRTAYVMDRMFKRAVHKGYIKNNPMDSYEFKRPRSKKDTGDITALSEEELKELISVLKNHDTIFPVIYFMLHTGTRTQEALAIKWEDIDFENNRISINKAMTKEMVFDEHGNKLKAKTVVGPTKNKSSIREIGVPESLIEYLADWRVKAPQVSKTKTSSKDFVFGNVKESSWTCDGFRTAVNNYLRKSGSSIKRLRLHRLRHTVATMLSNQPDATVFHVMQLLGHRDIRMAQKYVDKQRVERREKNQEMLGNISEKMGF